MIVAGLLGLATLHALLRETQSTGARDAEAVALEAVRIAPDSAAGEVIEASLASPVRFIYEIRNVGTRPAHGLNLEPPEYCHVIDWPAETVPIGGKTRLEFIVRSFHTGNLETWIPVQANGCDRPPLVLITVANVPLRPPWLQETPETVRITVASMQTASRQLLLEAVERDGSPAWITGLEVPAHLTDVIQVIAEPLEERPDAEPGRCTRTYRFRITATGMPPGIYGTSLRLISRLQADAAPHAIPLEVRVSDN